MIKKHLDDSLLAELFALIVAKKLHPVIGATYGLSEAQKAHEAMRTRQTSGKVTLDPGR